MEKIIVWQLLCIVLALLVLYFAYTFNTQVNEQLKVVTASKCYDMMYDAFGRLKIGNATNFTINVQNP